MSIDMYLGDSDRQNQSVSSVVKTRDNHYNDLKRTLAQFHMSSPFLSGVTYDSAKNYSQKILIPLIKAGMLLDEAVKESCESFTRKYREEVDTVDLRESELLDKINRVEIFANQARNLMSLEFRNEHPNATYLRNLQRIEDNHLETKRLLEEKLAKLRAFNSNSRTVFAKVDELYQLVQKGINEATHSWSEVGNQFVVNTERFATWDRFVKLKWSESSYHMQELIEKGRFMTEQDIYRLINYLSENPKVTFFWNGIDAILEYLDYKRSKGIKLDELLVNITTSSSEEFLTKFLSALDDSMPRLSDFIHVYMSTNKVFNNTTFSFDVNGYTKALFNSSLGRIGKVFTSGIEIPISNLSEIFGTSLKNYKGKPLNYGITGVNSLFLGLDFFINLQTETVGTAFTHTITTSVVVNVGLQLINDYLIYAGTQGALEWMFAPVATMMLAQPIGWTIITGTLLAYGFDFMYKKNVFGIKDTINHIGNIIDKNLESVGRMVEGSLNNLKLVFGE